MIDQLSGKSNIVLATGGGAVLAEENRKYLSERGTVVYLQASIAQQAERTSSLSEAVVPSPKSENRKLRPGFGFGGPCYPRDNRALAQYAASVSYPIADEIADDAFDVARTSDPLVV